MSGDKKSVARNTLARGTWSIIPTTNGPSPVLYNTIPAKEVERQRAALETLDIPHEVIPLQEQESGNWKGIAIRIPSLGRESFRETLHQPNLQSKNVAAVLEILDGYKKSVAKDTLARGTWHLKLTDKGLLPVLYSDTPSNEVERQKSALETLGIQHEIIPPLTQELGGMGGWKGVALRVKSADYESFITALRDAEPEVLSRSVVELLRAIDVAKRLEVGSPPPAAR